jgi:hypothetical protein
MCFAIVSVDGFGVVRILPKLSDTDRLPFDSRRLRKTPKTKTKAPKTIRATSQEYEITNPPALLHVFVFGISSESDLSSASPQVGHTVQLSLTVLHRQQLLVRIKTGSILLLSRMLHYWTLKT